ncbi:aminodeoxychorismate lyase [Secundilactobacillus pentosiphilus]|uniref:Endolytic murein transglycosylase n=1 Tax=Secundilactobacillus pentosiphilus TaxID=1714682 RepID=A0A1Z5ILQ3_9LACO|nr:aminodeoxychorismate lyase [Secundilactobacillus pentosiphilus]GAX05815.1 aminodeoxychorismate lyase [Secundilactobacillus pentosiphilus]
MDNDKQPTSKRPGKKKMSTGQKIITGVVSVLVILLIVSGVVFYHYFQSALKPLNPKSEEVVQVDIPMGASSKQIGSILQDKKIVKNGSVFNYYVKSHNYSELRAGYYQLKASMTLNQVAKRLQQGGTSEPIQSSRGKVLIPEGAGIADIANKISSTTDFSKAEFLSLMKNQSYMKSLEKRYPDLLSSSMTSKGVRYHLEGYLYPATYIVNKHMSLKGLVNQMVAHTNDELSPYYKKIKKQKLTVQQVMTLASLVEREGVSQSYRRQISGVFFNRIAQGMPLQSDVAVEYAIGHHKQHLSSKDLQSDSPYNLYKFAGYGPGPFNNPSMSAIQAVLNPSDRSKGYLYFVANTKTGKIYFSKSLSEHNKRVSSLSKVNN